jgi:hypothetical protein
VVKESMRLPARVWREVMAQMLSPEAEVELAKIKLITLPNRARAQRIA